MAPAMAATVALASLWVPWIRTGTTTRSAFQVISALRGAGLMRRVPDELFFIAVALVPGLVAAAWGLWATGCRRVSAGAAALAGALTVAASLTVRHVAHHRATASLGYVTAAGGTAMGIGVAWLAAVAAVTARSASGRPAPRRPAPSPSGIDLTIRKALT